MFMFSVSSGTNGTEHVCVTYFLNKTRLFCHELYVKPLMNKCSRFLLRVQVAFEQVLFNHFMNKCLLPTENYEFRFLNFFMNIWIIIGFLHLFHVQFCSRTSRTVFSFLNICNLICFCSTISWTNVHIFYAQIRAVFHEQISTGQLFISHFSWTNVLN